MGKETVEILKRPIQYIKGVGEARSKLFHSLNLYTVEDVISYFPRQYEDRSNIKNINEMEDGESCAFEGTIASSVSESRPRRGLLIYKVKIQDQTGTITATWFNQQYIKNVFNIGDKYIFYGRITRRFKVLEIQNPVYEKIGEIKNTCRIIPVYQSTARLTQNIIRSVIRSSLDMVLGNMEESLPQWLRSKHHLSEFNYCLQNIHFPNSDNDFENSRYRLVFEEFLFFQLGLLNIKNSIQEGKSGFVFKPVQELEAFIESLPFKLTTAQLKVFKEIESDMESPNIMNRLVQGDVGSGKTIVAVLALFKAVRNGYQGTLMVPTEILAEQHFKSIEPLMGRNGIHTALLTGSMTKKEKTAVLTALEKGEIDIIIGTHALIEDNVSFKKLGLVITDEQHRFGVRQRAVLSQKGGNPDVLVMTATPIPRTLALILYGDLDISIIDELPPGRKPIKTYSADNSMRDRINSFIRKIVSEGRQVYIVCPLVEESEMIEAKSATEFSERIALQDFSELRVGLIHGKMRPKDKDDVMRGFVDGDLDILVSTTVIEVGVNVPNATVMVIENAERFGLAQLHQLRGRVGRGEHQSFCILYNEGKSNISKERMKVMQKTGDGFIISEKDLELRGPGEFFGTRQHGLPEFKIANIYKDMELLKVAQSAAMELLNDDPELRSEDCRLLKEKIVEKFKSTSNELSFN
ncbi:MAG: ATP-dependent helicase RecG [Clostridiales bacterium]|nr:ATP-dependent helicase RecG [Clostridiales bacterium]